MTCSDKAHRERAGGLQSTSIKHSPIASSNSQGLCKTRTLLCTKPPARSQSAVVRHYSRVFGQPSLLKDHPRIRHVSHREPDKLPPIEAELVQLGLHRLSIGNHLDDLVLIAFRLLSLDREWLNKEQQKSKNSKADDCDQPRD